MEICTFKSQVMVNNTNNASEIVIMDGEKVDEVSNFKCLGAILTKDSTCNVELHLGIAAATAAMARLTRVWKSSLRTRFKPDKSLVVSIFLYGCETWGRYHGGRRPSSDDSLHSPTVIPPPALDKPSIMKSLPSSANEVRCDCTFAEDGNAS